MQVVAKLSGLVTEGMLKPTDLIREAADTFRVAEYDRLLEYYGDKQSRKKDEDDGIFAPRPKLEKTAFSSVNSSKQVQAPSGMLSNCHCRLITSCLPSRSLGTESRRRRTQRATRS